MAHSLIYTKDMCDNVAAAGWGLNGCRVTTGSGGVVGGAQTLLAVPLTLWTRVSNSDSE